MSFQGSMNRKKYVHTKRKWNRPHETHGSPRKQSNKKSYKEKNELIQMEKGWGAEQDWQTGVIRVKRRRKGR